MAMKIKIMIMRETGDTEEHTGLTMDREIFMSGVVAKVNEQILLASKLTKQKFTRDEIMVFLQTGIENKFKEFAGETKFIK